LSNIDKKIKETKNNGYYVECDLIGDGSEDNPYRPEIFNYGGYYHLDTKDIDYTNKKVKLWVSKKETKPEVISAIKKHNKIKILKETKEGKEI